MKPAYKYIFLLLLVIFTPSGTYAQRENPLRIELNANLNMEDYNLVPCGEKGVLVFFESESKGSSLDTKVWHFALYDKNLNQKWLADTALADGVKFKGYEHANGQSYLLFLNSDKRKASHNLQILKVNFGNGDFVLTNTNVPEKSELLNAEIIDGKAVLALNNPSFVPQLVFVDLNNANTNILSPEIEGLNILQQFSLDQDGKDMLLVVENYIAKKQNAIMIMRLDRSGTVLNTYRIMPAIDNKVLNSARIAESKGDTLLLIGTYSNDVSRLSENIDETGAEAAGYFITKFVGTEERFINYFNFLEFEEMYRALSSKTIADLRRKAEKQKSRGEEYSLDYTLILHDVVSFDSNYVLISEAYYPEYRTVTNMYYDYYGRPIPQTYTVFDGYRYISAIAGAFTPAGEMLWDNGLEFRNILTFKLGSRATSFVSRDEMVLFYSHQNKLNYKMIGEGIAGEPAQNINIESKYRGDRLMEDMGSQIVHWYDNFFLCYGYQVIKNNRVSEGKRTIFYFNKLAFN